MKHELTLNSDEIDALLFAAFITVDGFLSMLYELVTFSTKKLFFKNIFEILHR